MNSVVRIDIGGHRTRARDCEHAHAETGTVTTMAAGWDFVMWFGARRNGAGPVGCSRVAGQPARERRLQPPLLRGVEPPQYALVCDTSAVAAAVSWDGLGTRVAVLHRDSTALYVKDLRLGASPRTAARSFVSPRPLPAQTRLREL